MKWPGKRTLIIGSSLVVVLLLGVGQYLALQPDLKAKARGIAFGMPREQVEAKLGKPVLTLKRTGDRGQLLVWTDQLWQLDVVVGRDESVESLGFRPSDSFYRRTVGHWLSLLK